MSKPKPMPYALRKLRIMKPAPARSTSVSTSSTTMSALVQRRARMPLVPERPPPSFITSPTSVFEIWSAGARPNRTPVPTQINPKNATTNGSIVNVIQYGFPNAGLLTAASNIRTPTTDTPSPRAPLASDSSTLSTSSWRTMRQRPAPSETRTAISRDRAADRASSRFATFAHAIRRTKPTAPINDRNTTLIGPFATRSL